MLSQVSAPFLRSWFSTIRLPTDTCAMPACLPACRRRAGFFATACRRAATTFSVCAVVQSFALASAAVVPGAPQSLGLTVLSNDTIEASFTAPLSDGGAAITSYRVDWDTAPGTREVQVVSSSINTGPNEIQTIFTTCADVDEIQTVTTQIPPAAVKQEIQQVVVSNAGTGYFTLVLDTSASGGSRQLTSELAYSAGATGSNSVQQALQNLQNVPAGMVFAVSASPQTVSPTLVTTTYVSDTQTSCG